MSKKSKLPEASEPQTSMVSIKNYPVALCREHTSRDGTNSFHSVSFIYQGSWASFIIKDENLTFSTRCDGEANPDHFNLALGEPDDVHFVSVKTGGDEYNRIPMFNSTIEAYSRCVIALQVLAIRIAPQKIGKLNPLPIVFLVDYCGIYILSK